LEKPTSGNVEDSTWQDGVEEKNEQQM